MCADVNNDRRAAEMFERPCTRIFILMGFQAKVRAEAARRQADGDAQAKVGTPAAHRHPSPHAPCPNPAAQRGRAGGGRVCVRTLRTSPTSTPTQNIALGGAE
jgi:hypothetical protein